MKREDLEKLGLEKDGIDSVMALHGKDIESHKTTAMNLQGQVDTLTKQLGEANTAIDGFKKLDVDAIKKAAEDWEAKAKQFETDAAQAKTDAEKQVKDMARQHALEAVLKDVHKVKNVKAAQALLNLEELKYDEDKSEFTNLADQVTKIKESDGYLFADEQDSKQTKVKVVSRSNSNSVLTDPMTSAAWQAAGLSEPQGDEN